MPTPITPNETPPPGKGEGADFVWTLTLQKDSNYDLYHIDLMQRKAR